MRHRCISSQNHSHQRTNFSSLVPVNISTFFQRCVRFIWCHNVGQRQINVETTLYKINLGIYRVEQRRDNVIYFNVDMNVETTSAFTTLSSAEMTLWIWTFVKKWKLNLGLRTNLYFWASNKNHLMSNTLTMTSYSSSAFPSF